MTLTVTLSAPYSNFPAVAGFQTFFPMPEAAVDAGATTRTQLMIGNGPYTMESPRTDEEIVLVKNDTWNGDFNGDTWDHRPDRIVFRMSADADTSYNALEAGEGDTATHPGRPRRRGRGELGHHARRRDARLVLLPFQRPRPAHRRPGEPAAPSGDLAGDRPRGDQRRRVRRRPHRLHGHHAAGHPRVQAEDMCEYCAYDPEAAQAAFDEWTAAGNALDEPMPIQFNAGGVHGTSCGSSSTTWPPIGIEAEADGRHETTSRSSPTAPA